MGLAAFLGGSMALAWWLRRRQCRREALERAGWRETGTR
jgi:hypothetical protein